MADQLHPRFRESGTNAPPGIGNHENRPGEGVGRPRRDGAEDPDAHGVRTPTRKGVPDNSQARVGKQRRRSRDGGPLTDAAASELLEEYRRHLIETGNGASVVQLESKLARGFVRWLRRTGHPIRSIDDKVLREFRDERLTDCSYPNPAHEQSKAPRRVTSAKRFILFLEATGRVDHPGEAALGNDLLEAFVTDRAKLGYAPGWLSRARMYGGHFLGWLHMSRTSIRAIRRQTVDDFCQHDCVCRGCVRSGHSRTGREEDRRYVSPFVASLAEQGEIACEPDRDPCADDPEVLVGFATWLREQRGVGETTIRYRRRHILQMFSRLRWDPSRYDAAGIRKALERVFSGVSRDHAGQLSVSARMFLRFLSAKGACRAALIEVVPRFRRTALAEFPRYLSEAAVRRVINTCDCVTPTGLRDYAILLLLSGLGLRAGDVTTLRHAHIDWSNGRIIVSGKSRRQVSLPLPQEVGDAILAYLERGRPRVPHPQVFLWCKAPYSPFSHSGAVSQIVRRALKRAGVESPGGQGGHVLRHSFATQTLREGASLEVVGTVLRHKSPTTTALYAKVDFPALQAIAQPWIRSGDGA